MIDKEIAEEYIKDNYERWVRNYLSAEDIAKENFIAGLKVGSQLDRVWHDYDAGEDCYEDTHEGKWIKRETKESKWYYPSKGEYPKDDTEVLVAHYTRFNFDTKQPLGELQCKIAGYLGKKWINLDTGCGNIDYWLNKPDMVYAWKEIELPKE